MNHEYHRAQSKGCVEACTPMPEFWRAEARVQGKDCTAQGHASCLARSYSSGLIVEVRMCLTAVQ